MHLAQALAPNNNIGRYHATRFLDMSRHAELSRQAVRSSMSHSQFRYSGSISRVSTENFSDRVAELVIEWAKRYVLEFKLLELHSTYAWADITPRPTVSAEDITSHVAVSAEKPPLWVKQVNEMQTRRVGEIANSVKSILLQLQNNGPEAVTEAFKKIDFKEANDYHLVAVLRAISSSRSKFDNWSDLIKECRALLKLKNINEDNINDILQGLDG